MKFYTNVHRARNGKDLLVTGYDNGKPFSHKERYEPYLFLPTENPTGFRTLDGRNVEQRWFNTMWDARQFIKKYEGVDNFEIFGLDRFEYVYLYDKYHGEIKYDPSLVSVVSLDIEVAKNDKGSFASVENADGEITLITLSKNGKKVVFGCGEYKVHAPNIQYYRCVDERAMLMSFLTIWNELHPDILTGWNIDFYDIPMLVNRINRILGEEHANRMSPWRTIDSREVRIRGRTQRVYELVGISILDYLALYQKFTYTNQESYKLDHIAFIELDERKLDYTSAGYATLQDLYEQNFQLYTEYNIRDVELVDKLDDKMKLIELVMAMAYDAKVNYNDTLATVRPWDALIHNFLMDRRIVVHQFKESTNFDTIVGGHVKQPVPGMYNWVASFDLNSLYPMLVQEMNISPETLKGRINETLSVDDLLSGDLSKYSDFMKEENVTIAGNGTYYTLDHQGFLSEIMERIYADRSEFKKKKLESEKIREIILEEMHSRGLNTV